MPTAEGYEPAPPADEGRLALGAWGERVAERHLRGDGLVVVDRNWRIRDGELDLVAWDDAERTWVAVEVKTRRSITFGDPIEAVTRVKAARLRRLARAWVVDRRPAAGEASDEGRRDAVTMLPGAAAAVPGERWTGARLRIDVVGVLVRPGEPVVTHLRAVA